jgi:hypothetical protein
MSERLGIQIQRNYIMMLQAAQSETTLPSIEKIASGQKLIIYAILVYLISLGLKAAFGDIAGFAVNADSKLTHFPADLPI